MRTSDRVPLDETELLGRTQDVVATRLSELGLNFDPRVGTVAPTAEQVGLAYSVNPKGNVRKGEVITVSFYAEIPPDPEATKPSAMTVDEGPYPAGSTVTFSWTTYAGCPADHALSGFNIQTNGTIVGSGATVDPDASSVDIKISGTAGQDTSATYTALCTDLESPQSDPVTVTAE
jgi:serine/threonine-protein kinase